MVRRILRQSPCGFIIAKVCYRHGLWVAVWLSRVCSQWCRAYRYCFLGARNILPWHISILQNSPKPHIQKVCGNHVVLSSPSFYRWGKLRSWESMPCWSSLTSLMTTGRLDPDFTSSIWSPFQDLQFPLVTSTQRQKLSYFQGRVPQLLHPHRHRKEPHEEN